MALVKRVFDDLSKKLEKIKFNSLEANLPVDENSSSSFYDQFAKKPEETKILPIQVPLSQTLEIGILERKIKQLINKLNRKNISLHVFDHTDIQYGPILGKGAEGVVQRCRVCYNNMPVDAAVKTVLNSTEDNLDVALHELELLCLAKDPIMRTVVQVYGVAAVPRWDDPSRGHLVIVTEIGLKNLLQLYQEESIPLHVTLRLWHNLAIAIHFLHCKHIIHQDLKPENILVTSLSRDKCGSLVEVEIKIIDLGLALLVNRGKVETDDVPGTMGYHAPEVLFDTTYDFKADIFVLAVVYCVMLLPQPTLQSHDQLESFLTKVHTAKKKGLSGSSLYFTVVQDHLDQDLTLPASLVNLICKMLERVEDRHVSLLEIAALCLSQASLLHQYQPASSSSLSHAHDSGVNCDTNKRYLRGKKRPRCNDDDDDDDDDDSGDDNDDVISDNDSSDDEKTKIKMNLLNSFNGVSQEKSVSINQEKENAGEQVFKVKKDANGRFGEVNGRGAIRGEGKNIAKSDAQSDFADILKEFLNEKKSVKKGFLSPKKAKIEINEDAVDDADGRFKEKSLKIQLPSRSDKKTVKSPLKKTRQRIRETNHETINQTTNSIPLLSKDEKSGALPETRLRRANPKRTAVASKTEEPKESHNKPSTSIKKNSANEKRSSTSKNNNNKTLATIPTSPHITTKTQTNASKTREKITKVSTRANSSKLNKTVAHTAKSHTTPSKSATIATEARTTRSSQKPRQFFRSVETEAKLDEKEEEEEKKSSGEDKKSVENPKRETRRVSKSKLEKKNKGAASRKKMLEVMRMSYNVTSDNIVQGVREARNLTIQRLKRHKE